jgi:riboflavin synthase
MYTGIVQAVRPVTAARPYPGGTEFRLRFSPRLLQDLQIGASVAVEGVCLSVTAIEGDEVSFDAMDATLARTNLAGVAARGTANVERSARPMDENGGHAIAGHIATTAEIVGLETGADQAFLRFRVAPEWSKYIFPRGFLAVNGCSLTVAEREPKAEADAGPGEIFRINLIPETLRQTTFTQYRNGDRINIEVDHQTMVMVDTIEQTMATLLPRLLAERIPA